MKKLEIENKITGKTIFTCNYKSNANLQNANLRDANLRDANLRNADFPDANLQNANLQNANLRDANLRNADLRNADLRNADLRNADLLNANLRNANLRNANLRNADLRNAYLRNANLQNAYLRDVKTNYMTIGFHIACPEEGSFIGWKKAGDKLIKLSITWDSLRSSATTSKCRASKVVVLDIEGDDKSPVSSNWDASFVYEIGKTLEVKDFDTNRWNECSTGIHFFMNKENAINF